ncbi:tetratricopeptide (TPR) repeat protein [Rhodovulum iodosum]|uniref:Tetratricopeptide (TPR) repeat protein n=1 Tax=Rhodovulum iodosum TaxID=68291 RepID=A0ABV3XPI4_9RHOB|nr:surface lipoprotein assembly modifier [Rhodovulum robiginosum]RSK31471.1 DUF560 domain-containing protein [Rhodovulum robiginosum]
MRLPSVLRQVALSLALALTAGAGLAEPARLSPEEMRATAAAAVARGEDEIALRLAEALLARDPDDGYALTVKARAARNLGLYDTAIDAGRAAWRVAETDADRYAAAMVTAQAMSSAGQRTWAQIWLRRAAQTAPDDRREAMAARDYRYVRSRNPWSSQLHFAVTPSSNINDGAESDTIIIGGVPFLLSGSAQALSGLEFSYGAATRYRFRAGDGALMHVGANLYGRAYRLSSDAKEKAPDLDAGDLAYQSGELNFGVRWPGEGRRGVTSFDFGVGKVFYGGDPLADIVRAELGQSFALTPRMGVKLTLSSEGQWRDDNSIFDSTVVTGLAEFGRRLDGGDRVTLGFGLRDTVSEAAAVAHDAQILTLSYDRAKPVAGAYFSASLAYERRDYDKPLYGGAPREDDRFRLAVSVVLPEFAQYGFAPEIGLNAVSNRSNISLYESEEIGLTVGFRSTF